MTQGFLTVATGEYFHYLAINMRNSYHYSQKKKYPLAVITDPDGADILKGYFDDVVVIQEKNAGYINKLKIQVLSPYNSCTMLSADKLNRAIRECVNPGKLELSTRFQTFRDGDRVIITKNDRDHDCSNGDVGILHITDTTHKDYPEYHVQLSDGRCPQWDTRDGLYILKHAYALTVHKSQGSEYDRILFPVSSNAMNMMYRNLFYTAISRGRKQVVLYGSRTALSVAMQREADARKTMLVVKTRNKQTLMCA